jgi:alanine racemase
MRLTRIEIDLQSLRWNYNGIRKRVGNDVKIMGIVKANAYGHGIVEVARAFSSYGMDYLGVGFLEEGILLREHGITVPILVLGGVLDSQVRQFLEHNLEITVSSIEIAERIENEAKLNCGTKARVHVKIDTGMERIGVRSENAVQLVEKVCRLQHLELVGIYSHFATADEGDKTFAVQQLEQFTQVLQRLRVMGIEIPLQHIANSGAILDIPESYLTLVRPGILLYGAYPSRETSENIPLRQALTLKSKIVYIKDVPEGISISYGRKYFTKAKTRIATVPIGYGDGYSRVLSNQSDVLIVGHRYPVVGTICMDQLMVDIGTESRHHVGDDVVLIGKDGSEEISAWEISEKLGTIPYEVLTGIAARVPRIYIQG